MKKAIEPPVLLGREQKKKHPVLMGAVYTLLALFLCFLILDYVVVTRFYVIRVGGSSMMNTLYGGVPRGGEYVGGDILYAYRGATADRGDIVIVDVSGYSEFSLGGERFIIKRLIAKEGDSVRCEGGTVYLKEAGSEAYLPLEEPYVLGRNTVEFDVTLGEGEIYVMGDNREVSLDSRRIKARLKESDIVAVVPQWSVRWRAEIKVFENIRYYLLGWITNPGGKI